MRIRNRLLYLTAFGSLAACGGDRVGDDGGDASGGVSSASGGGSNSAGGGIGAGGTLATNTGGSSSAGGAANAGGTGGGIDGGVFVGDLSLPVSPYIVVDQFGYLPDGEKIATIRDPETGFDAEESFTPGATYALVNATTGFSVSTAAPVVWGEGAVDAVSGDRAWT